MMPIGVLSRQSGVHIETIRYYERECVLPKPRRSPNRRRLYSEEDVRRLAFIRHARDLGFDLASVKALLALQEKPERSCRIASDLATAQLAAVESRLDRLKVLRRELRQMIAACQNGRVGDCRVIGALAKVGSPNR